MPPVDTQKVKRALQKNPILKLLDPQRLESLLPHWKTKTFKLGQIIITQGEASDGLYVIVSGKARVVDADRNNLTLAVLGKGDGFGERSLLYGEASIATVRASGKLTVIKLAAADFKRLVSKNPQIKTAFIETIETYEQVSALKKLEIFSKFKPSQIEALLPHIETQQLPKGQFLFRQGDPGDAGFVIQSGRLQIVNETRDKVISIQSEGSLIGEIALIENQPRTASARALEDCRLIRLNRRVFDEVLPRIKELIEPIITRRLLRSRTFEADADKTEDQPDPQFTPRSHRMKIGWGSRLVTCLTVNQPQLAGLACIQMLLTAQGLNLPIQWRQWVSARRQSAEQEELHKLGWYLEEAGLLTRKIRITPEKLKQTTFPNLVLDDGGTPMVVFGCRGNRIFVGHPQKGYEAMSLKQFKALWNGEVLQAALVPDFALPKSKAFWHVYARFLPLVRPHKTTILWIMAISVVLMLFGLAGPFFTQTIIDKVLVFADRSMLKLMLIGMLFVTVFQLLGDGLRGLLSVTAMQRLEAAVNARLFNHVVSLPLYHFEKFKVGDYATRFEENRKLLGLVSSTGITLVMDLGFAMFYLVLLFNRNTLLALVGMVFVAAQMALVILSSPKLRANDRQVFEASSQNMSYVIEMISGILTIKSLAGEKRFFKKGMDHLSSQMMAEFTGARFAFVVGLISQTLTISATLSLLALGATKVMGGQLTVGEFVAFNAVYGLLMAPVGRLVGLWDQIQEIRVSSERINDILEMPVEAGGSMHEVAEVQGHVLIENLYFRYPQTDQDALSNINLEIQPGQKVALVGRSGCGKSTLINLLLGFQKATAGHIYIDSADLSSLHPSSLLKHIGVVEQKPYLFNGTIRENIAKADPGLASEQIVAAAAIAGVKEFTDRMPLGLDTRVGEGGMSLSGGQIQRIAIARAIVRQPTLLILDEATSALDTESESMVQKNLDQLMQGRTSFVIAHRLSTIINADLIVVMDEGRVVETGSHETLMAAKGLYHYLFTAGIKAAA